MGDSESGNDKNSILQTTSESDISYEHTGNFITRFSCGLNCDDNFKWAIFPVLLVSRTAFFTVCVVWFSYCFFVEFHTTHNCKHFDMYSSPEIFRSIWLFISLVMSLFLVFYIRTCSPAFCGTRVIMLHLLRRVFFWKIIIAFISVTAFDVMIIVDKPNTEKTISYVLFIMANITMLTLVFHLNFLPEFCNGGDTRLKRWSYKIALFLYSLENHVLALIGSTIAVYKVLPVSDPVKGLGTPSLKTIVDLMLLITYNGFRYYIGDFFVYKLFDETVDILGSARSAKKIRDSIATEESVTQSDHAMVDVSTTTRVEVDKKSPDKPEQA